MKLLLVSIKTEDPMNVNEDPINCNPKWQKRHKYCFTRSGYNMFIYIIMYNFFKKIFFRTSSLGLENTRGNYLNTAFYGGEEKKKKKKRIVRTDQR